MDKIQRDIEQLEKESTGTTDWKTGMEDLLMSFKSALEKLTGFMEGINNNQTALNETIAMLSKREGGICRGVLTATKSGSTFIHERECGK